IRAGKLLSATQVQGIVHLVSSSVELIQAKDVVVVDLKGNILSGAGGDSEGALMTTSNHKFKRGMEKDLEKSIVNMLEDALGPGKIIARVSADINFDKVEKTEEIFDPDSQVVRSEQSMAEQVVGSAPPGGLAGAESLLPTGAGQAGGAGSPAKRNNEKNTFNYEINKVVRRVSQTVGDIKKLSVAVLVDGVMTGDPPAYQARSAEEMNQLLDIVKSAVGFNQSRGDQIQLENIQFDRSLEASRAKVMEEEEMMNWAMLGAKVLLGVIIVLIIFLRILRPLVNWVTTSVEVLPEEIQAPSAEEVEAAEEEKRLAKMTQQNMEVRKAVADFVDTDAKYAAGVLRKWMRDRG
ncbi:MAG: flagellar basal-body MS-ring/collar protein FliF, partial [Nitrospinaceae bacterium]